MRRSGEENRSAGDKVLADPDLGTANGDLLAKPDVIVEAFLSPPAGFGAISEGGAGKHSARS